MTKDKFRLSNIFIHVLCRSHLRSQKDRLAARAQCHSPSSRMWVHHVGRRIRDEVESISVGRRPFTWWREGTRSTMSPIALEVETAVVAEADVHAESQEVEVARVIVVGEP